LNNILIEMRLLYRSDLIQISEFVAQGDKEKEFWQTILQQIPDLADGDVLLFQVTEKLYR